MPLVEDITPIRPGECFCEDDSCANYWINRGKLFCRHRHVKGADISTFMFYSSKFGNDEKHCYYMWSRLAGGNGRTFRPLNYTYVTDGLFVWTVGGRIKDVDAATFVVCDDGFLTLQGGVRVPYGFGKDRAQIYYYNYDGKPNLVRKADPSSFVSLNDGHFAYDDQNVYCGAASLPRAKIAHWRKIGGYYSKDDRRIFYFNRHIKEADYDTFEVLPSSRTWLQMARDAHRFYNNDNPVSEQEFFRLLDEFPPFGQRA